MFDYSIPYNECLVILPINASFIGYEGGHFDKVYELIIKPSIIEAGFFPVRVEEISSGGENTVTVINHVINSPAFLCDTSTKNGKVMTNIGLRKSYNKPMVLIQDNKTPKIQDADGQKYIEYNYKLTEKNIRKVNQRITNKLKRQLKSEPPGLLSKSD